MKQIIKHNYTVTASGEVFGWYVPDQQQLMDDAIANGHTVLITLPKPDECWDTKLGKFVQDIALVKHEALFKYKSLYEQTLQADVTYKKIVYQADAKSLTALADKVSMLNAGGTLPKGFFWVTKDNSHVSFTAKDVKALYLQISTRNDKAFLDYQTKKKLINSASTIAEIGGI